jgi:hypothetical protein
MLSPLKGLPFPVIVKALAGNQVIPIERKSEAGAYPLTARWAARESVRCRRARLLHGERMRDDVYLEVVWDGAHNGCDGDLLHREVALPEKRSGANRPVTARKEVFAIQRAAVLRVLETTRAWLTLVELATSAGCTTYTANQVVYLQRQRQQLDRRPRKDSVGVFGKASEYEYRLRSRWRRRPPAGEECCQD